MDILRKLKTELGREREIHTAAIKAIGMLLCLLPLLAIRVVLQLDGYTQLYATLLLMATPLFVGASILYRVEKYEIRKMVTAIVNDRIRLVKKDDDGAE